MKHEKKHYDAFLHSNMSDLWDIAQHIHAHPELGYEEKIACHAQCSYLEANGFQVRQGIDELHTAYVATFGSGNVNIAILAEYDALPEIGHGCGHNLICTSTLGAAIEVKKFMEEEDVQGTLTIIGTPAEEGGGGKIKLLAKGIFQDVDAVFMMHPTSGITRLAGECMSSMSVEIDFIGKSAHAGSHPEDGINALSAANLYFVASGMLRQHFKGDLRLSGILNEGGKAAGMIPDHAKITGRISSFSLHDLKAVTQMIETCAKGCALAMGCNVKVMIEEGYQGRIPNTTLSNICRQELTDIEEPTMEGMPFDYGGEDLGNISRVIPICNPYVTLFNKHKISNHTIQFRELANSKAGKRCLEIGASAIARSVMELYLNPLIIDVAKEELKKRLSNE